jgi:hypothetical protein
VSLDELQAIHVRFQKYQTAQCQTPVSDRISLEATQSMRESELMLDLYQVQISDIADASETSQLWCGRKKSASDSFNMVHKY